MVLQNELTPFGYSLGWRWRFLKNMDILYYYIQKTLLKFNRSILNKSSGYIKAIPNPAHHYDGLGSATIKWESRGTKLVEVHVDYPNGPLFSRTENSGEEETGRWIYNGRSLYLQDISDGLQLSYKNTIDMVRVFLTSKNIKF